MSNLSYQDGKNNFYLIPLSTSRKCFLDQMALMHIYVRRAKFQNQISFVNKIRRICTLRMGILFDSKVLEIWKCKMSQLDNFKTSVVTMLNRHYSCSHSQGTGKPKWTNQKWIKNTKRPLCGKKKRRVSEYQTWIWFYFWLLKKNGRRLFSKSQGEETDKT